MRVYHRTNIRVWSRAMEIQMITEIKEEFAHLVSNLFPAFLFFNYIHSSVTLLDYLLADYD